MIDNAPPSRNPADNDSMPGLFKTVLRKFLQRVDDMLPAQVMAYNRTTNRAQIQPLIDVITTSNQRVTRAQIASVPVQQTGGGGFVLSFPLTTNDLGWLKSNDRDISLFTQFYKQSPPNTLRFHDFKDAVLLPDTMMQGVTIADEDTNNAVFQNLVGTVKISLWPTMIKILAAAGVGIGGTPGTGMALDVRSTTAAFAPPRMTMGQRNAIPSPTEGMTIYNLTTHALEVYTNTGWP